MCILLVILTFMWVYTFTPKACPLPAITLYNTPLPYMFQWFCLHHLLCYHWFILAECTVYLSPTAQLQKNTLSSGSRNRKWFSKCIKIFIVPLTPVQITARFEVLTAVLKNQVPASHTAQHEMLLTLMHIITPVQLCQRVMLSGHTELWTPVELSVSPSPSSAQTAGNIWNVAINILCRIFYTWRWMLSVNVQMNSEAGSGMVHPEMQAGCTAIINGHLTFHI